MCDAPVHARTQCRPDRFPSLAKPIENRLNTIGIRQTMVFRQDYVVATCGANCGSARLVQRESVRCKYRMARVPFGRGIGRQQDNLDLITASLILPRAERSVDGTKAVECRKDNGNERRQISRCFHRARSIG